MFGSEYLAFEWYLLLSNACCMSLDVALGLAQCAMEFSFGVRYHVYLRIGLFGGSLRSSNHMPTVGGRSYLYR